LFKRSPCGISRQTCILANAGCQRLAGLHLNSQTPAKKSKLHPLSDTQKASNRALSRKRRNRFGVRFNLIAAIQNMELDTKR
jgi:hypothetical protein